MVGGLGFNGKGGEVWAFIRFVSLEANKVLKARDPVLPEKHPQKS